MLTFSSESFISYNFAWVSGYWGLNLQPAEASEEALYDPICLFKLITSCLSHPISGLKRI